jgi:uncharacterized protein (DUF927 family)
MDAASAFRPLEPDETRRAGAAPIEEEGPFEPLPPPPGSEPPAAHPTLGRYVRRWAYFGPDGVFQGYQCRFDAAGGGKEFRPLRYGRRRGREGWHWKGWGEGRPFYRLRQLLADPGAPVLVVEGEKAADAAAVALLGQAAVSPMNGAKSPHKTDWSVVAGREVTIWPDADQPGREFANTTAKLAGDAGATAVRVVVVPDGAPEGWDLADLLPEGWTAKTIEAALAGAAPFDPEAETQGGFRVLHRLRGTEAPGLYRLVEKEDKETGEVTREWVWFASRVEVLADTRDAAGEAWGRLLGVHDRDGTVHRWAMPMATMAGSGEDYRRELLHLGMVPGSHRSARGWLAEYLATWRPAAKARCVDRVGWHGKAFVLPDRAIGDTAGEQVLLQTAGTAPEFKVAGSLEGWRIEVAASAAGNSRLVLAVSAALAGPLLYWVGEESGGFHYFGPSSIGKTAALHAARSVWGVPLGSWRTTDNAAEALARGACDALLTLDEIGQAPAQVVEALAYLLGNQRGKARMRRDTAAKACSTWRLLFLSTGELGLATKLAEGGKRAMAGQAVRVVEIPADAGRGLGVFDTLHGFADGGALAEHLRLAADRQGGHAGRAFLDRLTARLDHCAALVRAAHRQFVVERCPKDADGQVRRVCGRFGLTAAAGELGISLGVLPWERGEAERAAVRCFGDWRRQRGGNMPAEVVAGLQQVRLFLEQHGSSRFEPAWLKEDGARGGTGVAAEDGLRRTVNRAGFRRADTDGNWTFYVLSESWAGEVCKGFDHRLLARAMAERGWLERGEGKNLAKKVRVPGAGEPRLYVVPARFLAGEEAEDADR